LPITVPAAYLARVPRTTETATIDGRAGRMRAMRLSHGLGLGLVALSCALLPACAQGDDAGSAAAGEEAAAGVAMDVVDAPACLYGASGDELTSRPSPPDSSVVRLGEGAVKVCYSAPSARDRQI